MAKSEGGEDVALRHGGLNGCHLEPLLHDIWLVTRWVHTQSLLREGGTRREEAQLDLTHQLSHKVVGGWRGTEQ